MELENLEEFELGKLLMFVTADHRFGTDAFLLANYANVHRNDKVCDLCTGCGIIPLIFCKNTPPKAVYGMDIQEEAIEVFKKSVSENHLENTVFPVLHDLRDFPQSVIKYESMDVVTANPPYMTSGSGYEKLSRAQAIARHELMCDINDVCSAAFRLLKFGGRFAVCQRPERLADVICAMRKFKIEPKTIRFVLKNENEKPWLFLISGKKGAAAGMTVEKPLYVSGSDNSFSEEFMKIYE